MADQEEEDLRMALRMSMQQWPPEPKRSKPRESGGAPTGSPDDSPEAKSRRLQRELMAAAAEKRLLMSGKPASPARRNVAFPKEEKDGVAGGAGGDGRKEVSCGMELSDADVNQLFSMVFGNGVSKGILAQWCNQGIRFSPDPETFMGLVQHEGGPCGVLAAIQAFVLKYLIFFPDDLGKVGPNMPENVDSRRFSKSESVTSNMFSSLTEDGKARALVRSMGEILFLCGSNKRAVIATLSILVHDAEGSDSLKDDIITKALEGVSIESASDLQKILRVNTYTSIANAYKRLEAMIPVFQSRMGALLFLISALLSRGLYSLVSNGKMDGAAMMTCLLGF